MQIELKVLSIPVDSVRVIGGWIVGRLKDLEISSAKDNATQFDQLARFSLSFSDGGPQIGDDALYEFVNIAEEDAAAAAQYIESHGIFTRDNLVHPPLPFARDVEEFWRGMEAAKHVPFVLRAKAFYSVQRKVKYLQKLASALRDRNTDVIDECMSVLDLSWNSSEDSKRGDLSHARSTLRQLIQAGLSDIQLGVAEWKSSIVPFAAPSCLESALYLALLNQITRGIAIGECENPRCKKIFERSQPRKMFCSPRCQALVKVHRFRNKLSKRQKNLKRKEQR